MIEEPSKKPEIIPQDEISSEGELFKTIRTLLTITSLFIRIITAIFAFIDNRFFPIFMISIILFVWLNSMEK